MYSSKKTTNEAICANCGTVFQREFGVCPNCGTPVDETPVNPTPVNPTPVNPTPVNPTPVNPTPINATPVNETPVNAAPVNEARYGGSVSETPSGGTLDNVREALFNYIYGGSMSGLLNGSAIMMFLYPLWCVMNICFYESDFVDNLYVITDLLKIISLVGVVFCFARKQSSLIAIASGVVSLEYMVEAIRDETLTLNYFVSILFFVAICIWAIKNHIGSANNPQSSDSAVRSHNMERKTLPLKWIALIVFIVLAVIIIIIIFSNVEKCTECGKLIFGKYYRFGEHIMCEDCFYNN